MDVSEINERFGKFINSIKGDNNETDMEIFEIMKLQEFIGYMIDILKTYPGKPILDFDNLKFKNVFEELKKIYKNTENNESSFYKSFVYILKNIKNFRIDLENSIKTDQSVIIINHIKRQIKNFLNKLFEILTIRLFNKEIDLIFKYLKTIVDRDTFFFLGEIVRVFMEQRQIFHKNIGNWEDNSIVSRKLEPTINNVSQNINNDSQNINNVSQKQKRNFSQEIINQNTVMNDSNSFVKRIKINIMVK